MENDYKRMLVVGITYNKIERGVYALILQELGGTRRLPIVIGMAEAQSIECKLQEIITPRPLTHDLMVNIMRAFGLQLKYMIIKQIDGGIFAADLHLTDGERDVVIDSRSSDGISIAIRMGVPIYVSEKLLSETGISRLHNSSAGANDLKLNEHKMKISSDSDSLSSDKIEKMETAELEGLLESYVEKEEYEKAARLRDIINNRKSQM